TVPASRRTIRNTSPSCPTATTCAWRQASRPPDAARARDVVPPFPTRMILRPLALLLVVALPACSLAKGKPAPRRSAAPRSQVAAPAYPGFGYKTTGGTGRPVFTVTTLADAGPGSLRDALALAGRDGGTIRFRVGGDITLASGLDVPGRTTIDGSSAPPPGITLWGQRAGAAGTGVLN